MKKVFVVAAVAFLAMGTHAQNLVKKRQLRHSVE